MPSAATTFREAVSRRADDAVDAPRPGVGRPSRRRHRRRQWPYLVPLAAVLAVWVYGPLCASAVLSLFDWDLTSSPRFVGLSNYRTLLADPQFRNAAWRTVLYAGGTLPFALVLPLLIATALWRRPGRAATIYRYLLFTPMMLAPVATAISWQFVLDPLQGIEHAVFSAVGATAPNWLGDPRTALWVIVVITSGKLIALNVLLIGAALSTVDGATVEAARLDGASEGQITRLIVVPQLRRTLVLLAMMCVVYAGQWSFTNISVLTQGGPSGSTDNVYYRLYTYGFTDFDIGQASAGTSMVLVALAIPLAIGAALRKERDAHS